MRKLLLSAILLTGMVGTAQTHQKEIISFVEKNVGKKVGTGYCYELVQSAFRQYAPTYDMGAIKKDSDRYGSSVKKKDVQAGDICLQKGPTIDHLSIVYRVAGDSVFVAEQNTGGNLKKSKVEVNYLSYEELKENYPGAKVSFFRPE